MYHVIGLGSGPASRGNCRFSRHLQAVGPVLLEPGEQRAHHRGVPGGGDCRRRQQTSSQPTSRPSSCKNSTRWRSFYPVPTAQVKYKRKIRPGKKVFKINFLCRHIKMFIPSKKFIPWAKVCSNFLSRRVALQVNFTLGKKTRPGKIFALLYFHFSSKYCEKS